jgi:hypothetical protein
LRKQGLSFKKMLMASEQARPKVARRRAQRKAYQHRIDAGRLIFVDETWVKTNVTRTRGWSPRSQPFHARAPFGHWKTLTFIAGLRDDQIVAPWVIDDQINAEAFNTWIVECLVPILKHGDIAVLDNLSCHENKAARDAVRKVGARLFFLPRCSPDLNPIEMMFAKLKTLMRKAEERTVEACWKRVGEVLKTFSPSEC